MKYTKKREKRGDHQFLTLLHSLHTYPVSLLIDFSFERERERTWLHKKLIPFDVCPSFFRSWLTALPCAWHTHILAATFFSSPSASYRSNCKFWNVLSSFYWINFHKFILTHTLVLPVLIRYLEMDHRKEGDRVNSQWNISGRRRREKWETKVPLFLGLSENHIISLQKSSG